MLEPGIPERMHFSGHAIEKRDITDPTTLRTATRNVAVFDVDWLNGESISAKFSVMAEKLYAQLEPYIRDNSYRDYQFVITKTGTGFTTSFSVQVIPKK